MSGFRLRGRVLVLSENAELIARQIRGQNVTLAEAGKLRDRVSTDEITPAWACYYFDRTLARYCLVALAGEPIAAGEFAAQGFEIVVAGESFGYGSSRETAPFALREAGVRLIIARSVEKIFAQNCQNLGVLLSSDFGLLPRLLAGETVARAELIHGLDELSREVVEAGGLFAYNRERLAGKRPSTHYPRRTRPQTLAEKILARNARPPCDAAKLPSVSPGEAHFVRADLRFSHDYVTAMADSLFRAGFGEDARVREPASLVLFRDHLTLLEQALTPRHRALKLLDHALELRRAQERFAQRHSVRLFDEVETEHGPASYGICHNVVVDELARPGSVVVGTDSHTCMAGALGAFAFGVGSTDMANAFYTCDVRVTVPETVRVELKAALAPGTSAKDVMLWLLAQPSVRRGALSAKVLEFGGAGLASLSLDERATLTNMAVEASAFTGIAALDERAARELAERRHVTPESLLALAEEADPEAHYADVITIDLSQIVPMVALPGDPKSGVALRELLRAEAPRIDIAYAGSCTGSKASDLDIYAAVLAAGLAAGRGVAPHVRLYIQLGSARLREYAEQRGYLELFRAAGAIVLEPACGACIGSGPGVSENAEQVTVSAVNRNFPGRSGPGRVYLASPWVVGESALAGHLALPPRAP